MLTRYSPGQRIDDAGTPFTRSAVVNSVLESAEDFQRRRLGDQKDTRGASHDGTRLKVKNSSGADRRRGELLEFTGFALNAAEITNTIWLTGGSPTLANGFGILVRPIPSNDIDDCQVAGACYALVNVTDANHKFANVSASTYVLQSAATGPVRILYKDSGTGEKECAVLLDAPFVEMHRGIVNNGGSPISKGGSGNVKRYTDGTSSDSGIVDAVTCDWNAVADGKKIIYVKLGGTFYMLSSEKTSQTTLTNIRQKADNTYVEAEELDIYVDSIDTAAWEDKIELDECA
jgi:hypothetical protein